MPTARWRLLRGARDRRAHVVGVERRQFLDVLLDQLGELEQERLPFGRLPLAPRPREGLARRGDGTIDVLLVAFRHVGKKLAVAGLRVSKVLPDAAGTQRPSISISLVLPSR